MVQKLFALLIIIAALGAINWGLVGAANMNLVEHLARMLNMEMLPKALYILIGLAGVYTLLNGFERLMA